MQNTAVIDLSSGVFVTTSYANNYVEGWLKGEDI